MTAIFIDSANYFSQKPDKCDSRETLIMDLPGTSRIYLSIFEHFSSFQLSILPEHCISQCNLPNFSWIMTVKENKNERFHQSWFIIHKGPWNPSEVFMLTLSPDWKPKDNFLVVLCLGSIKLCHFTYMQMSSMHLCCFLFDLFYYMLCCFFFCVFNFIPFNCPSFFCPLFRFIYLTHSSN